MTPYASVLAALVFSWIIFVSFMVYTSMQAIKGKCPVCKAIKDQREGQ